MIELKKPRLTRRIHVSTSIEGLLSMSDVKLRGMMPYIKYDGKPFSKVEELRETLTEAYLNGEKYIADEACDNFDPAIGCLGHPITSRGETE